MLLIDFDGTITSTDTFPLFIKQDRGIVLFFFVFLLFMPLLILFKLKWVSGEWLKEKILSAVFKGRTIASLEKSAKNLLALLEKKGMLRPDFISLILKAKEQGDTIAIVSASPEIWVKPFCDKYKCECIATRLNFEWDKFTGRLLGINCNGNEKVNRVKQHFDLNRFDEIIAYGNSKEDEPMLKLANKAYWINKNGNMAPFKG